MHLMVCSIAPIGHSNREDRADALDHALISRSNRDDQAYALNRALDHNHRAQF
jgi:hypothetical protein